MQIYDIAIAPGVPRQIDAEGDYFYFYTGSAGGADASIQLQGRSSGLRITLQPGQAYKLAPGIVESSWILTNRLGGGTIIGTIVIGKGGLTDNRITGSVEVIDGGRARTQGNAAFYGYSYVAGVASTYAHAQIWNPVGSLRNMYIEQIYPYAVGAAAQGFAIRSHVAALPSLTMNAQSKNLGGAASLAEMRNTTNAVVQGNIIGTVLKGSPLKLTEPILLQPGNGLSVINGVTGEDSGANFEFFEERL